MALVTATGMDTILGNVLRLADQTRKLPPPEGSGYDPTAVNVPLHFDSLEVQLNNRSVCHFWGLYFRQLCGGGGCGFVGRDDDSRRKT